MKLSGPLFLTFAFSEAGSKAQILQFDPLPALKFLLINAVKACKLWQCLSLAHLTCITDQCILTL